MRKRNLKKMFFVATFLVGGVVLAAWSLNMRADAQNVASEDVLQDDQYGASNTSFFIENNGQIQDKKVLYYMQLKGDGMGYVSSDRVAYDFSHLEDESKNIKKLTIEEAFLDENEKRVDFNIATGEESDSKISYFMGNDESDWKSNVGAYYSLSLGEIWENINVELNSKDQNIEKVFVVNPGGDASGINIELKGARNGIADSETGELLIQTNSDIFEELRFSKPFAYQEIDGERVAVYAAYKIKEAKSDGFLYGFEVGEYDKSIPLVIDPVLAGTYVGGSSYEETRSCGDHTVDGSGNVIITGSMLYAPGYPTTPGAYDETWNGNYDTVVSKFDSNLTTLIASTILGGSGDETGSSVRVDSLGNIFVLGGTSSTNFPVVSGSYDETYNGNYDMFVSKFNSDLTVLESSTYLGGSNDERHEFVGKMLIDSDDKIYVSGTTQSPDFPTVGNVYDASYNGGYDIAISKFSNDLSNLELSTFVGGGQSDIIDDMVWDEDGDIAAIGGSKGGFPVMGYDTSINGWSDYIVFKISGDLLYLEASTYLGGGYVDTMVTDFGYQNSGIAVDSLGNVFVTGATSSPDFPTTSGAYDEIGHGLSLNIYDGFVSKFDSGLDFLLSSTFLGGNANKEAFTGITINSNDNPVVIGWSSSTDYPTTSGAFSEYLIGGGDVILTEMNSDLSGIEKSTYFGGTGGDYYTKAVSLDSFDNPQFLLTTRSSDFPVSEGAFGAVHGGGTVDMAFARLSADFKLISNTPPSDIDLSAVLIFENQPIGTTIGDFSATDPDVGDNHTYSLSCSAPGADDSFFDVLGNSLLSAAVFDYESPADSNADGNYEICVRADDGNGGTYDENFTISVIDVWENSSPIVSINSADILTNASGKVLISVDVSDFDGDVSKIKVEYESDEDGNGDGPWANATLIGGVDADFGTPVADNMQEYQISNIETSSGSNTLQFHWRAKYDVLNLSSNQYIRITANDGMIDGEPDLELVNTSSYNLNSKKK